MGSIERYFKKLSVAELLILVNIALFLVTKILVITKVSTNGQIHKIVGLPQNPVFFIEKPWTIFTYAFFHNNFSHLFWNMVLLYFIGQLFLNLFPKKAFLKIYFLGIFFSGLIFLSIYYFFPSLFENSIALGASGAIMCVLIFLCYKVPHYSVQLFFSIRLQLWYIGALFIIIDLIQITLSNNIGGRFIHLGGALTGLILGLLNSHKQICENIFFLNILTKKNKIEKAEKKIKNIAKNQKPTNKLTEEQQLIQHKTNKILEKISTSGYTSLTDEEKKFLFHASKNLND